MSHLTHMNASETRVSEACTANVPPHPQPVPPYRTSGGRILMFHRNYVAGYTLPGPLPADILPVQPQHAGNPIFGGDKM